MGNKYIAPTLLHANETRFIMGMPPVRVQHASETGASETRGSVCFLRRS